MILEEINLMGRHKKRQVEVVVPRIVEEILRRLVNELYEDFEEVDPGKVLGRISKEMDDNYHDDNGRGGYGNQSYGSFNLIPSKSKIRGCTELLITICSNYDSFEKRLLESLDHVSQHCKNTKDIYFFTTKWNSSIFDKYQGYIDLIRAGGVNIVFVYVGKEGYVMMPE